MLTAFSNREKANGIAYTRQSSPMRFLARGFHKSGDVRAIRNLRRCKPGIASQHDEEHPFLSASSDLFPDSPHRATRIPVGWPSQTTRVALVLADIPPNNGAFDQQCVFR
jgi:hypothetical protein